MPAPAGVTLKAAGHPLVAAILTSEALEFLADLHRRFEPRRRELLEARQRRYARIAKGERPDFLAETKAIREGTWTVAPPPADLVDRRVEITGPTDAKMLINALNSGARVFMADFEDANVPTWSNFLEGHHNLTESIERRLTFDSPEGKSYRLNAKVATLVVRPRGWHLPERHVLVAGEPMSGSLFDAGLYLFRNAKRLVAKGSGPYFYLPKMESHLEARLWRDVFAHVESRLGLGKGAIKCTVLVETILAAFEMEEILHELKDHSCALNAGRWDYMFSIIKKFRAWPSLALPDRGQLTMTVPFMRAYTELLVRTCHARGAHAMGGMAAFIPNRRDPAVNETALAKVREDKLRESQDGFDGTWVAHPDLVPVATEIFDTALGAKPNQVARRRDDVRVTAKDLLDFRVEGGRVTEAGLRSNIGVGIQYIESWLRGVGAVAIHNLMEDAATAEIARSLVYLWTRRGEGLPTGAKVTPELVRRVVKEEVAALRKEWGDRAQASRLDEAARLFEKVAIPPEYPEFLTLPAYELLN